MESTEQQRILQLKNGNSAVFEALFREHYAPLCGFANKFVGEAETAEELVQELFTQIWEKRKNIQFSGSLRSYLFASVRNSALNHLKHLKVRKGYQEYMVARETEPEESNPYDVAELQSRIDTAIEALPERCRQVFLLSRREGLKYAEIAEQMEISVKTVEVQMGKALRSLRQNLKAYLPMIVLLLVLFPNG